MSEDALLIALALSRILLQKYRLVKTQFKLDVSENLGDF